MTDANGRGSRQLTAMQLEAQRRGWLLWPKRGDRCKAHNHMCIDDEACPACFEEAKRWQIEQRADGHDTARARTFESSVSHVDRMEAEKVKKNEKQNAQRRKETIEKRAAAMRSGKAAAKRRECKPKSAKRTERLWV